MNVNYLVAKKQISKYNLSKSTGIPYSTISDICNGKTTLENCNAKTVYELSKFFDVSMEDLLYKDNDIRHDFESFRSLSGCFVRVKNRIKSGFFALEALSYLHFRKVGSNRHFCRFWGENRGDRGEKAEEGNTKNYISQNRALNRQNLCSRCIK